MRPWAVLAIALGTVIAILDSSIANTALPAIAHELHADAAQSIWVVNGFQLAVTMTILVFASLGDARGTRFVFRIGLLIFTLGSLLCALSRTLSLLVAARVFQGIGAAGIMAVGPALYRQVFPPQDLGKALGLNAVVVATSAAAGPTIGGALLAIAAWPWLFAVNVPIGLVDVYFSGRFLPHSPGRRNRLDLPSMLLSALGFGAIIYGIDGFARHEAGLPIAVELAVGAVCGTAFVRRQTSLPTPMIAVDLFGIASFSLASITSALTYTAQGLAFVSLPFFFQAALGRTPLESGLLLTSWPVATAIAAPFAGRLSDRYPAAVLSTAGLAVMATGLALYANLGAAPRLFDIVLHGAICGFGFGFFQSPNNRELVGSAPQEKVGSASGVLASMRLTGQTLGAALVAIVFGTLGGAAAAGAHTESVVRVATPVALWLACGCTTLAMCASALRLRTGRPSTAQAR